MYDTCFDRVVVIYDGLEVFSGHATDAEAYFLEMGWEKGARQTTPDYLTSCTSPTERRIRKVNSLIAFSRSTECRTSDLDVPTELG